jgi:hypothetical protein
MDHSPHSPDPDEDPQGPDTGSTPGMPRWVKVFLIVALVLVLLFLVLQLISGGEHGPRRHGGVSGTPVGVTEAGGRTATPGIDLGQPS